MEFDIAAIRRKVFAQRLRARGLRYLADRQQDLCIKERDRAWALRGLLSFEASDVQRTLAKVRATALRFLKPLHTK